MNYARYGTVRERLLARWWFRILGTLGATVLVGAAVLPFVHDPLLAQCLLYGTLAALMIGMEAGRKGSTWYTCGLYVGETTSRELLWGASVAVLSLAAIALAALAIGGTFVPAPASARPLANLIATITIAAIGEEILFRGTIFQALEERLGGTVAVLLTSFLFAAAHAGNPDVSALALVNVFLAGVLMSTMLVRSASLWPSIVFHIVWNLLVALCFGDVSGNDMGGGFVVLDLTHTAPSLRWLVSGAFGVEEGLLTTILLMGTTIAVAVRIPRSAYVVAARFRRSHLEALTSTAS